LIFSLSSSKRGQLQTSRCRYDLHEDVGCSSSEIKTTTYNHLIVVMMADQTAEQQDKRDIQMVERTTTNDDQMPTKDENPLMRSKADDLSVWQTVTRFKRVGFMAMAAAFCAALDGYRKIIRYIFALQETLASQRIQSADSACAQRSILMAASLLIRDLSSSLPPLEQRSS
jgi:hypothetical protein